MWIYTMFTASGYMESVMTPRCDVRYSTISCRAPLFTSFHLRSDSGSETKSNSTQHCRSFWMKSSSRSAGAASAIARQTKICNYLKYHYTCLPNNYSYYSVFIIKISIMCSVYTMLHYIKYTVIYIV